MCTALVKKMCGGIDETEPENKQNSCIGSLS